MKKIGSSLTIFGVAAIVLNFLDLVPRRIRWIYAWGEMTAWIIMLSMIAVGLAITFLAKKQQTKSMSAVHQTEQNN